MAKDIYQALNEVMKDVGYVQKERSTGINYSYAGEVALIKAIRPHFVKHGIVIHPFAVKEVHGDAYKTKGGVNMNRATVVITYRIAHAPSGSFIDVTVTGEGADIGDKTFNKALTGAYKYALRQTLMIETGDDPDKFPSESQEAGNANSENGNDNNGKRLTPVQFIDVCVNNLGYTGKEHVRATMKLLGITNVPHDADKRKMLYVVLKAYRHQRDDKDLSRDDALAVLDGEKE